MASPAFVNKGKAMVHHVADEEDEILYSVVPVDMKDKQSPVTNSDDYQRVVDDEVEVKGHGVKGGCFKWICLAAMLVAVGYLAKTVASQQSEIK